MNITLFTSSLSAGGAERSLVVLAAELARRGHDVSVVSWNSFEPDFYELPGDVERITVPLAADSASVKWYAPGGNLKRLLAIRRTVAATRPDVAISFLDGTNELFLLSSVGGRFAKILSCQNNILFHPHYNRRWELLRKHVYRWADLVVFLDEDQASEAGARYRRWRCEGVPNPVADIDTEPDAGAGRVLEAMAGFEYRVAAMGRLAEQKGFDLLLRAFAQVAESADGAGLVILGEGPMRAGLEAQARDLGLQDRVLLPGAVKKPHAVVASCDLFAFSSRYEGQGMALAEALACGVPAVSFDCPSGPARTMRHGVDGLLVPAGDVDGFAAAIVSMLHDTEKRRAFGEAATEIRERLSPGRICERWEAVFDRLMRERRH